MNSFKLPNGINEDTIRAISRIKNESSWVLDFRLKAYQTWLKMEEPHWAEFNYEPIDYSSFSYFALPQKKQPKNLEEVDPRILKIYQELGIPLNEREKLSGIAVDAVVDSQSVATTYKDELKKLGIVFCSFSEALKEHKDLVQKYMNSVVTVNDNFFSALNAAVFSDGTFIYIPKGVKCPIELSTYFRLDAEKTGQFERTLIIADEGSELSYLEGCSAPSYDERQLHCGIVEIVALKNSKVFYSTVQNWYSGDEKGKGGIYNFVTKRAILEENTYVKWTQLEVGSLYTWKYPSCILKGDNSKGEFYSVTLTNKMQAADTGTKMIHIGKNTTSNIIAKGISVGNSNQTYRSLVKIAKAATNSHNQTKCDGILVGGSNKNNTVPVIENNNNSSSVTHEATTSKVDTRKLNYLQSKGMSEDEAISLIINGFCKNIIDQLPNEFAFEAKQLINVALSGKL